MNIMLDIETLSTKTNALVLTIGVVKFDPFSDELHDGLHIKLSIDEQISLNRSVLKDTVVWWESQDKEIIEQTFSPENRISVREGLLQLTEYINSANIGNIWGQGYGFDMTVLSSLYEDVWLEVPWKFYQERDSRTLFSLLPEDPRPQEAKKTLHNALSDAYYQAVGVQKAMKFLNINNPFTY